MHGVLSESFTTMRQSPSTDDLPRDSRPSRGREFGLRDPVKAGLAGVRDLNRLK